MYTYVYVCICVYLKVYVCMCMYDRPSLAQAAQN